MGISTGFLASRFKFKTDLRLIGYFLGGLLIVGKPLESSHHFQLDDSHKHFRSRSLIKEPLVSLHRESKTFYGPFVEQFSNLVKDFFASPFQPI